MSSIYERIMDKIWNSPQQDYIQSDNTSHWIKQKKSNDDYKYITTTGGAGGLPGAGGMVGAGGSGSGYWSNITTIIDEPPSLSDIEDPSYQQSIECLQHDGLELKYLDDQLDELCAIAIGNNPLALAYVHDQTVNLCKMALKLDWNTLGCVRDPSEEIIKYALKQNSKAYKYINKEKFKTLYQYGYLKSYEKGEM